MLILGFSFYMVIFAGCEDNSSNVIPENPDLETLNIICHDLSPRPGAEATLTVQVDGYSPDGAWPVYTWEAEGGSFPEGNSGISIKWTTPEDPGIYRVSVMGSLEGVTDTISKYVMVRNFDELYTGRIFNCSPIFHFGALYFFAEAGAVSPRDISFLGFHCYRYSVSGNVTLVSNTEESVGGGLFLKLNTSGNTVSGSFIRNYFPTLVQQRLEVWIFPLAFGDKFNITRDGGGIVPRMNQHITPEQDQFGQKVVWEARIVGDRPDGTQDLSNIGFWNRVANDTIYVTNSHDSMTVQQGVDLKVIHRYYNNIKPVMTPSGDTLIYFVDTTGVFEPCKMGIEDNPVVSSRKAMMISDEEGIFEQAGININRSTLFMWNKTFDLLGFISRSRQLCFLDYKNETVTVVDGVENIKEFAWSPDESECAVVNDEGIWRVSVAGAVSNAPVYVKERSTDEIIGINWSPNIEDPKIGFRMVRKGKTVEDSYSALVLCMLNTGINVYASPSINWFSTYELSYTYSDYSYMRIFFTDEEEIYAPFPTPAWSGDPDRNVECAIFHSYE